MIDQNTATRTVMPQGSRAHIAVESVMPTTVVRIASPKKINVKSLRSIYLMQVSFK